MIDILLFSAVLINFFLNIHTGGTKKYNRFINLVKNYI